MSRHGWYFSFAWLLILACSLGGIPRALAVDVEATSGDGADAEMAESLEPPAIEKPWDYDPYRVLIWIASSDPDVRAETVAEPLRSYLLRDFAALWRMDVADAPAAVRSAVARGIAKLDFDDIVASDPVIAVKKTHPDAIRIRFPSDIQRYVGQVLATPGRVASVQDWASKPGAASSLVGIAERLVAVKGDAAALKAKWEEEATESLLLSHGMATGLDDPEAKLIALPIAESVADVAERYDKVFLVQLDHGQRLHRIRVVELEALMQTFGRPVESEAVGRTNVAVAIGRAVTDAFSPTIRIEESGTRTTRGLVRAGGLIQDSASPGQIAVGDIIVPMLRKNDRNGTPIQIGRLDWAYLQVTEVDGPKLTMELHTALSGGLPGRKNSRTFRTGLKVKPRDTSTLLRLHARGDENHPLIGYEVHEKDQDSSSFTLVGRTDWNGRLRIEQTDNPLRVLFVKNGGSILAKLPIVPGHTPLEVADLAGDDMRLQAEAYIRGVQNAIVDLVAIRELLGARIRLRIENGELDEAQELLNRLRDQPTNELIANDMGRKQTMFLSAVGRNANQRRKIDNLFSETRELLSKHINPRIVRDLEAEVRQARSGGG